jgi:hypothetical protein
VGTAESHRDELALRTIRVSRDSAIRKTAESDPADADLRMHGIDVRTRTLLAALRERVPAESPLLAEIDQLERSLEP